MKYAEDKDDETTDTDRYIIRVSEEEAEDERFDLIDFAYRIMRVLGVL